MRRALGGRYRKRFVFTEHHESHAASAFFPSPFDEAAILTLDGVGEWATASFGDRPREPRSSVSQELRFPHSLGLLYSAFTYYTGFRVNTGEYKLMGLAPYGEPKYVDLILEQPHRPEGRRLVPHGHVVLQLLPGADDDLAEVRRALRRTARGSPRRRSTSRDMDIAASIQVVTEEIMLRIAPARPPGDRHEEPLPGRRRGAQLRRQRPDPARGAVRADLDPAGGRRRGRGARGGPLHLAPAARSEPRTADRDRSAARLAARARALDGRDPPVSRGPGGGVPSLPRGTRAPSIGSRT